MSGAAVKVDRDDGAEMEDFDDVPTSVTMALEQFSRAIEKSKVALETADRAAERLRRAALRRTRPSLRVLPAGDATGTAAGKG